MHLFKDQTKLLICFCLGIATFLLLVLINNIDILIILYFFIFISILLMLIFLGLRNHFMLFTIMLFSLPIQRFYLFKEPFAFNIFNVCLIMLFILIQIGYHQKFVKYILKNKIHLFKFNYLCIILFIIFNYLIISYSPYKKLAIILAFKSIGIALLFFVTTFTLDRIERIRIFTNIVILLAMACSIIGILQVFRIIPEFGELASPRLGFDINKSVGIMETSGNYGILLNAALAFISIRFLEDIRLDIKKLSHLILFAIITAAVVISQSRSTYLAYFVSIICLFFGMVYIRKKILLLFATPFIIIFIFIYMGNAYKLGSYLIFAQPMSVQTRMHFNKIALEEFLDNPIFGTGKDVSFKEIYYYEGHYRTISLHNSFLLVLRYGGLVLFIPYFLSILGSFIMLKRLFFSKRNLKDRKLALGLFGALMACVIEMNLYMGVSEKVFWLLISTANSLYIVSTKKSEENNR